MRIPNIDGARSKAETLFYIRFSLDPRRMLRTDHSFGFHRAIMRATLICATAFAAACGTDDPQVPTTFTPATGATTALTGTVAAAVAVAPKVQILDAKGAGIKGLVVHWKVGAGSGGV